MVTPSVCYEAQNPEAVTYKRGSVCVQLTGFDAWLFRAMSGMYGLSKATEEFWWLWHKKEGSEC